MPFFHSRWPLAGLCLVPFVLPLATAPLMAQPRRDGETIEITRGPGATNVFVRRGPRALLGITVRGTGDAADTTGLLVERVADSSAAARAGLRVGERLAAIDGTSLVLDRRDVGDRAAAGVLQRRLDRALEGKKAGDQVTLVVVGERDRRRTVRATLAEPPALRPAVAGPWGQWGAWRGAPRRVLGITLAEGGSARDTAGLLVTDVTKGGAADKAGLGPGDRLVSIDGVDLRVDAADAGDAAAASARVGRLRRALEAAADSQPVRLEVLQDGRRRTMTAMPQRQDATIWGAAMPAMDFEMTMPPGIEGDVERAMERAREAGERAGEALRRIRVTTGEGGVRALRLRRDDLDVATVNADLATRLGRGTEGGLLVLRVSDDLAPLEAGDVILRIDGRAVTDRDVPLDLRPDVPHRVEVSRGGRTELLDLKAR